MKIIGIGHYSRTGKDTIANSMLASLGEHHSNLRAAKKPFAWKLKEISHDLYGWAGLEAPEFYEIKENEYLRDAVLAPLGLTPVEVWVAVGTPAMRQNVYDKTWIDYLLKSKHDLDLLIIPDVRFPNEVAAVREAGGLLVKVVRPGYGPRPTVADRALVGFRGWDFVVGQSGSMDELRQWAGKFANWAAGGSLFGQSDFEKDAALAVEVITPWNQDANKVVGPPVVDLQINEEMAQTILFMQATAVREGTPALDNEYVDLLTSKFPHLSTKFPRGVAA